MFGRPKTDPELLARIDALETAVKLLRVEWEEVYDKTTNALARLRKRDKDANKADVPESATPAVAGKADLWARAAPLLNGGRNVRR